MNYETLVVRASCPLDMYLITPESAVYPNAEISQQLSFLAITTIFNANLLKKTSKNLIFPK
jgi:hypothetical protein